MGGWRLVRLIGDPNPWDDPAILRAVEAGRLPLSLADWFRFFDLNQRSHAIPGQTEVTLGPAHGFGQTYRFGPHEFRAWMAEADAVLLFGNEWDRWRFLDVTDAPEQTARPPLARQDWQALQASFSKLNERRGLLPQYR